MRIPNPYENDTGYNRNDNNRRFSNNNQYMNHMSYMSNNQRAPPSVGLPIDGDPHDHMFYQQAPDSEDSSKGDNGDNGDDGDNNGGGQNEEQVNIVISITSTNG